MGLGFRLHLIARCFVSFSIAKNRYEANEAPGLGFVSFVARGADEDMC